MAWTLPKTWAYKESLASNDLNTYVKDNLNYLKDTLDALLPTGIMWIWPTDTAPTGYLLCRGQAISRTTYATLFAVIGTTYGVGDNSTTFNLPNGAGKTFVGKDSTQAEFDSLGETGGANTVTLAATQIPGHTHAGTTGTVSADHSHTFSGTSSDISANHFHAGPNHNHSTPAHQHTGTTSNPGTHTHEYRSGGGTTAEGYAANTNVDEHRQATEGAGAHTHTFTTDGGQGGGTSGDAGTGNTGYVSSGHTHTYSGATSGISTNHTHNFTSDAGTGGGQSHNNLQPYQVINYIIKF